MSSLNTTWPPSLSTRNLAGLTRRDARPDNGLRGRAGWRVNPKRLLACLEERGLAEESHGQHYDAAWEPDCVARARSGDPEAFEKLVDAYTPRIYSHAFRILRNREEAEDIVQETFLRVYRNFASFDATRPFRNWVYAIATNLALNAIRSRQRRGQAVALDFEDAEFVDTAVTTNALEMIALSDLADRLASAVCLLPAQPAALIHLHYLEGMTIREAAELLNMREEAAKVALHRARRRLRELLEQE